MTESTSIEIILGKSKTLINLNHVISCEISQGTHVVISMIGGKEIEYSCFSKEEDAKKFYEFVVEEMNTVATYRIDTRVPHHTSKKKSYRKKKGSTSYSSPISFDVEVVTPQ